MKPHTINVEDLKEWMSERWDEFASATVQRKQSSIRERKRFLVSFNKEYRVTVALNEVYRGFDINEAVQAYNSI